MEMCLFFLCPIFRGYAMINVSYRAGYNTSNGLKFNSNSMDISAQIRWFCFMTAWWKVVPYFVCKDVEYTWISSQFQLSFFYYKTFRWYFLYTDIFTKASLYKISELRVWISAAAVLSGMWGFDKALNSCLDHILSLEGSRLQRELATMYDLQYIIYIDIYLVAWSMWDINTYALHFL